MSANNAKVQAVIETTFNSAINKLAANEAGNCYSDLYVQVDAESGELLIYDEEDVLVEKTIIFDWVNTACDDDQFTQQVAATLKAVLAVLVTKKVFDNPCFLKPFSAFGSQNQAVIFLGNCFFYGVFCGFRGLFKPMFKPAFKP